MILFVPLILMPMIFFACVILCSFELFRALRAACAGQCFLALVFGILQFLHGLFFLVTGLAIFAGYHVYLYFVMGPVEYSRFLLLMGIGLLLVLCVLFRVRYAEIMVVLAWVLFWICGGLGLLAARYGYMRMKTTSRPYSPKDEAFRADRL
ncbi:MAG: hypothetical protein LBO79_10115 [Zoogloeaceae bacterium]|jgi:hypothetical protein|nr:hypothetical protein [Zoogloeaceae bacterium]